jgi:hypothetical protein
MERAGIIQEDQHIELLGGQLVVMTISPSHAAAVSHVSRRFQRVFADRAQVITQSPLRLSDDLEDEDLPQPDVMLVAGPEKVYADHPRPADVYLLVEVSDSTLSKDRLVKLPLYAAHGIVSAWTCILPHGVAGQLACHSPVTYRRGEKTFVRLLRTVDRKPRG